MERNVGGGGAGRPHHSPITPPSSVQTMAGKMTYQHPDGRGRTTTTTNTTPTPQKGQHQKPDPSSPIPMRNNATITNYFIDAPGAGTVIIGSNITTNNNNYTNNYNFATKTTPSTSNGGA